MPSPRTEPLAPARPVVTDANRGWLLLGLAFFALYACASVFRSGATWGLHALAYLAVPVRVAGLLACLALLWRPAQERAAGFLRATLGPVLRDGASGHLALALFAAALFLAYYAFPIRTEVYGDSRTILHWWADNRQLPTQWFGRIFDARLLDSKEVLTILLHRTVAHLFGIPIALAYRIVSAVAGALSLCLWVVFVRRDFPHSRWGPLLVVLGVVLGAGQIFFGHVENYAFAFLTSFTFLLMGSLMLAGRASFGMVLLLFLVAVKSHATAVYFLPAFLVLVAFRLARRFRWLRPQLAWRRLALWFVAPSLAGGAWLYFAYFRSYDWIRGDVGRGIERTFLPLVPPPPALGYALQSPGHLMDLGNVLLLVGSPVLIALLGVILFHRRAIAWSHPRVIFAVVALAYPLMFFLALNPMLSMPRDWDLYGLLGAPLLLLFATLLAHGDGRIPTAPVHGAGLAFAVFSIGFFALNASPAALSLHLEDVGEHVFRTYHPNAGYIIASAQAMERDPDRALHRRLRTVERLAPDVVGEDAEYTHLLTLVASSYRERGDRERAVRWMERAANIAPHDPNLALWLADYCLWAGRTGEAQHCVAALLRRDPRNLDALVQGAVAAARLRDLTTALDYLARAAALAPGDRDIAELTEQIRKQQAQAGAGG